MTSCSMITPTSASLCGGKDELESSEAMSARILVAIFITNRKEESGTTGEQLGYQKSSVKYEFDSSVRIKQLIHHSIDLDELSRMIIIIYLGGGNSLPRLGRAVKLQPRLTSNSPMVTQRVNRADLASLGSARFPRVHRLAAHTAASQAPPT